MFHNNFFRPLSHTQPFTFRNSITYLEKLQFLYNLCQDVYRDFEQFQDDVLELANLINERVGGPPAIQVNLANGNVDVAIPTEYPNSYELLFVVKQGNSGGNHITLPAAVTGGYVINPAPNSVSFIRAIPRGNGTWFVDETFTAIMSQIVAVENTLTTAIGTVGSQLTTVENVLTSRLGALEGRVDNELEIVYGAIESVREESDAAISTLNNSVVTMLADTVDVLNGNISTADIAVRLYIDEQIANLSENVTDIVIPGIVEQINDLQSVMNSGLIELDDDIRDMQAQLRAETDKTHDWEPVQGPLNVIVERGAASGYNAFPDATLMQDGRVLTVYGTGTAHDNMLTAKTMRMSTSGVWAAASDIPKPGGLTKYGAVSCASTVGLGANQRAFVATMSSAPVAYRSWINVSQNYGNSWDWQTEITWSASWGFINDVFWHDFDGNGIGTLFAVAYSNLGPMIKRSDDVNRQTWVNVSSGIGGTWDQGYSEATLAHNPIDNKMYLALRREHTSAKETQIFVSNDRCVTWDKIATIPWYYGNPRLTITTDGTFVLQSRYEHNTSAGGVAGYATSKNGIDWYKRFLNMSFDMYGRFVQLTNDRGIIVASEQSRLDSTKSSIYTVPVNFSSSHDRGRDTEWIDLNPEPGVETFTSCSFRVLNGVCHLTGSLALVNNPTSSGTKIFTLPVGVAPRNLSSTVMTIPGSGSDAGDLLIQVNFRGEIYVFSVDSSPTRTVHLSSVPPFPVK